MNKIEFVVQENFTKLGITFNEFEFRSQKLLAKAFLNWFMPVNEIHLSLGGPYICRFSPSDIEHLQEIPIYTDV